MYAAGSEAQPIRFAPLTAGSPWGALTLLGRGTAGSRLEHCSFEGAGGSLAPQRERPAALAVHDTDSVVLHKCHFRDNGAVDAALHAAYAGLVLEGTTIEGPCGTGIRAVRSGIALFDCGMRDLGGDALQLDAGRAAVARSRFERIVGRAVLAAAGSEVAMVECRTTDTGTAVEALDGSTAAVANCELVRSSVPVHAGSSRRNLPGASVAVANATVLEARAQPTAEARSTVTFTDCRIDATVEPSLSLARVQFADCDAGTAARRTAPPVLTVSPALRRLAGASFGAVRTDTRGVTDGR